jgi:hypothetical protein
VRATPIISGRFHQMAHLEDLIAEHLDWQGYVVKQNILVGKRPNGGWDMELDIVAYRHEDHSLLHMEPSLDAHVWAKREQRFKKKFDIGRKLIFTEKKGVRFICPPR